MKSIQLKIPAEFKEKICLISGNEKDLSILGAIEHNNGSYEPYIMNFLKTIIFPKSICLDIGANIGTISLALSSLASEGKIYSFEPSPSNFHYLQLNMDQNNITNVELINKGIYDSNCESNISFVEHVAGCSFMSNNSVTAGTQEKINCVKLDDWVEMKGLSKIDFIKLDVEGAELHAIRGAQQTLSRFKPNLIIEFNPTPIERFFSENPADLLELLQNIYPYIYLINDKAIGNVILIKKYSQLMEIVQKGKGWEDLYCSYYKI